MTEPLLRVEKLAAHFRADPGPVRAVDGVSFSLARGETLGVVGESGSGKSVTALSLLRLLPEPPAYYPAGQIFFEGRDLLQLQERELAQLRGNRLAMVFQDPSSSLNPFLTVGRQLTEVLAQHKGMTSRAARQSAIAILERVGISEPALRFHQYPHQLSGGMRQRVMIAMALLCEPSLLIADEPTTALDVTVQAQILALIVELQKQSAMSIILISHDFGVVAGIADTIAVMYAGRIVEYGSTAEVIGAPRHPYTRGLLQSMPRLSSPHGERLVPIPGSPPDGASLPPGCPFHPRCKSAAAHCKEQYPEAQSFDGRHWAACWRPGVEVEQANG